MVVNLIKINQQKRNLEEVNGKKGEEGQQPGHLGMNYCNTLNTGTHLMYVATKVT